MGLYVNPPFEFVPILRASGGIPDRSTLSLRRLREVVAGRDTNFSRSRGFALLAATDFPNKHRDFERVLHDESEPAVIRHLAALYLGRIPAPAAAQVLLAHTKVADDYVLSGVLRGLGCIGDDSALEPVLATTQHANPVVAQEAEFAATLIAHRARRQGPVSTPTTLTHLAIDAASARPMRITQASDDHAELCLRSIADQPYGIEFAEQPMYQVRCGRNMCMILLNREFAYADGVKALGDGPAIFGALATKGGGQVFYRVHYLILTGPSRSDRLDLLTYRTDGILSFSGTAHLSSNQAQFSIQALRQPGVFPLKIEGTFERGRLVVTTALSIPTIPDKRAPTEELRAAISWHAESADHRSGAREVQSVASYAGAGDRRTTPE